MRAEAYLIGILLAMIVMVVPVNDRIDDILYQAETALCK